MASVVLTDSFCRLELVVWLVPSLIGGAVAVSIGGVVLGPMYSIAMNQAGRVLPQWLLTGSIGWIPGFGQAGSVAIPFITGVISLKRGISSLEPLHVDFSPGVYQMSSQLGYSL